MPQQGRQKRVEAEMPLTFGAVGIVHNVWHEPIDVCGVSHHHHLELALLPTQPHAKACFSDHWGQHRFEPMGSIFLLPAHQRVHARSNCRRQNSIICHFQPEAVASWFEHSLEWTDSRLQQALNLTNPKLRRLLTAIGEEVRAPGFAAEAMVELLAAQTIIELSRHFKAISEDTRERGLAPWRLQRIDERLCDIATPPSLSELAQLCGLSVRHLARAFRISRGCSLGTYIAEHRLRHARNLLASGLSVKAVAYSTGFSSPSNFTAAFKRATGETPSAWLQRTRKGHSSPSHARLPGQVRSSD